MMIAELAGVLVAAEEHGGGFLPEYWSILTDPAHMAVEFTFLVVVDGILVGLLWPLLRRFVDVKLRNQHEEFDREHGIRHHGDHFHIDPNVLRPEHDQPDHG